MVENVFKVGGKAKCVNARGTGNHLIIDAVYSVLSMATHGKTIQVIPGHWMRADRFVPVADDVPVSVIVTEIRTNTVTYTDNSVLEQKYNESLALAAKLRDDAVKLAEERDRLQRKLASEQASREQVIKDLQDAVYRAWELNDDRLVANLTAERDELRKFVAAQRDALKEALTPDDKWLNEMTHLREQKDIAVRMAAEQQQKVDSLTLQLTEARNTIESLKQKLAETAQLCNVPQQDTVTPLGVPPLLRPTFPDWLNPDWWAAMDDDGVWCAYESEPQLLEDDGDWFGLAAHTIRRDDYTESMHAMPHRYWRQAKWKVKDMTNLKKEE